jgi:LuxR family transcriptional regulator, maltose regulon positive regulatory protein
MVETISAAVSPALAHIIERPRLIARLEEGGGSRVSMFAAPAGYGKTTLARQWGERQDCPVVWYRTNRASGDVALLAVQFDELFASLAPELPRDPGKVAAIAAANPSPSPLGRALVRTFEAIMQDVLVIVDEWEAAVTPESNELLSMIVDGIPVRWVITTRERPGWFTPRLKVYGDRLEIGVNDLRMTDEEAAKVLEAAGAVAGRARVMRTADGWPAVLGLAAMSGEVDFTSDRLVSHTLDEFLADELFAAAKPETQEALTLLAVSSIVDTRRAELLLGELEARSAIANASVHGLLAVSGRTALFFHPLLRDLLIRRFQELTVETRSDLLDECRRLFDHRLWDEALSVGERSLDGEFIADAIAVALDELLAAGRTSSLERWVNAARAAGTQGGVIDYAEAELALRQGNFDHSLALAACAGDALAGDLAARAHLVAARAAHLGNRTALRERHLAAAESLVTAPHTDAELRWLRFAATAEEDGPDAEQLATELSALDDGPRNHALRIATANLQLGFNRGRFREQIEAAEGHAALADSTADPYVSTSMLNAYSYALLLTGQYRDALGAADREISIAEEFELLFVVPYAQINRACALTALREFAGARNALRIVERRALAGGDPYAASRHAMQSAVIAIGRGDLIRATDHLARGSHPRATRPTRGEHHALHALVLSAMGRAEEADDQVRNALQESQNVEIHALLAAGRAIRSALQGDTASCIRAYEEISELGVVYPLVLGWRARYEVAAVLLSSREHRDSAIRLLFDANDTAIAKRAGASLPRVTNRPLGLSAREQEVCELLAAGRTNQEIATMLFISLSTTKVHVKHILEKLGVRSRVEAARLWEEGR